MPYTLTTVAAGDSVVTPTAELRSFLKIDGTGEDELLRLLLWGIQEKAEAYAGRTFTQRTFRLTLDRPVDPTTIARRPSYEESLLIIKPFAHVDLPRGPVQSITKVDLIDDDGNATAFDAANYYLTGDRLVFDASFPVRIRLYGGIEITYVAGFDDGSEDALPDSIRVGIMKALKTIYEHREDYLVGRTVAELPDDSLSFFDTVREVMA